MAIDNDNFILTNPEYDQGFAVEEYQGKYSLTSAYLGSDGQVRAKWCFRQEKDKESGKNVAGKSIPIKVELGSKEEAVERLLEALALLDWHPPVANPEDVPF